jgi:hypothetical protein
MTDLLETGDTVIETSIDFDRPRERQGTRNAQGYVIGVCRVCDQPASTPSSTYCADHKTRQSRSDSGEARALQDVVTGTDTVKRTTTRTPRGAPTGDEWSTKVFDKVLILLSALLAGSMVRRDGLNDPNDAIADSLTMESDEAKRIAKPMGRFMAATKFSKTRGRQVLENSDLLDAGFALYDYFDRINKTLRQYATTPQPLGSVSPIRPTRQPEEGDTDGSSVTSVEQPGIPRSGFPDLSGRQYVT